MSIAPTCNRCGYELALPGALVFGPPDRFGRCDKLHVCVACWDRVQAVATGKTTSS